MTFAHAAQYHQYGATPGNQVNRGIYFFVSCDPQQKKLQKTVLGTGASSVTGLLEVFRQSTSWLLISVPPLSSGEYDNSVCCKSISALACYSHVGLYYLVQKCQLIPAVTALLCRQPNYRNLLEGKSNGICWKTRFHSRIVQ